MTLWAKSVLITLLGCLAIFLWKRYILDCFEVLTHWVKWGMRESVTMRGMSCEKVLNWSRWLMWALKFQEMICQPPSAGELTEAEAPSAFGCPPCFIWHLLTSLWCWLRFLSYVVLLLYDPSSVQLSSQMCSLLDVGSPAHVVQLVTHVHPGVTALPTFCALLPVPPGRGPSTSPMSHGLPLQRQSFQMAR